MNTPACEMMPKPVDGRWACACGHPAMLQADWKAVCSRTRKHIGQRDTTDLRWKPLTCGNTGLHSPANRV